MPSNEAQFNAEVLEAHREALTVIRELMAEETDPAERRRLATVIFRIRTFHEPEEFGISASPAAPTPPAAQRKPQSIPSGTPPHPPQPGPRPAWSTTPLTTPPATHTATSAGTPTGAPLQPSLPASLHQRAGTPQPPDSSHATTPAITPSPGAQLKLHASPPEAQSHPDQPAPTGTPPRHQ